MSGEMAASNSRDKTAGSVAGLEMRRHAFEVITTGHGLRC